jgi:hypothetical protein
MTENDNTSAAEAAPGGVADWMTQANAYAQRKQAIFPANRDAIFEALERHGIEAVTLTFDGCGDSGQIDMDNAVVLGPAQDLAAIRIEQRHARWDSEQIETVTLDLRTALENLAYDLLEKSHGGWEINEGAFGEFTFETDTRSITLDYNERFESSVFSRHEF